MGLLEKLEPIWIPIFFFSLTDNGFGYLKYGYAVKNVLRKGSEVSLTGNWHAGCFVFTYIVLADALKTVPRK